jgi:hypothetical protein
LLLNYIDGSRGIAPPDAQALIGIEDKIREETVELRAQWNASPPKANVSKDTCGNCDVRHLCDAYWSAGERVRLSFENGYQPADWEVVLTEKLGFSTWRASVSLTTAPQHPNMLLVHLADMAAPPLFGSGDRIRIMGCAIETAEETSMLTIRSTTEVFKVV